MPRIFISYRRADSVTITGRIYDRLVAKYGDHNVFKDVDDIPLGADFRRVLDEEVGSCDVLLVIIGQKWLTLEESGQRRLDNPDDFVRIEVESGLNRDDVLVIPVLVKGAGMPSSADLPPTMRDLAYRNGAIVRDDPDFHRDMDRLIKQIDEYVKARPKKAASRPPAIAIPQTPPSKAPPPRRSGVNPMIYIGALGLVVVTAVAILLVLSGNNQNGGALANTPTSSDEDQATAMPDHDTSDDMVFPLGDPVPIGVLLTSESVSEHDDILWGIELAFVDNPINVGDETIEVRWEKADGLCDPDDVEENISLLLDRGVVGFIGPTCNEACQRAAEVLHEVNGVMISPSCDAPSLSFLGTTSFYRTIPPLNDVGWLLAKILLEDKGITDIIVIHGDTQRSIDVMSAFTDNFSAQGGTIYTALALPDAPDVDLTETVQIIQDSGAEAVYFTGTLESAVALAGTMKELNVEASLILHGDYSPEEFIDMAGELAEDVYFVALTPLNADEFQDWLNRYSGMIGEEPRQLTSLYAYDAATIFLNAIEDLAYIEDDTIHIPRQDFWSYVASYTDTTASGFIDCSLGGNCGFLNLALLHYYANELNVDVQRDDRPE